MKRHSLFLLLFLAVVLAFGTIFSSTSHLSAKKVVLAQTVATEAQVRVVQQRLRDWGYYSGPVTGYYGELTKAAVIRFQKKHGLNAAGYLGPLTLEKIGIYVPSTTSSSSSSSQTVWTEYDSTIITKVQQRLLEWGYFNGPVTGYYGELTRTAVISFQKKHGLNAEGYLGPLTLQKIGISAPSSGSTQTSNSDLDLLARCIYAEARGEPYSGQVAIAAVILNRVESPSFPNTIAGVIYQPWAFTAVNDGQINMQPNQSAYNAARDALNGWDPTYGCLFYYNPAVATSQWMFQKPIATRIGSHVFCY